MQSRIADIKENNTLRKTIFHETCSTNRQLLTQGILYTIGAADTQENTSL